MVDAVKKIIFSCPQDQNFFGSLMSYLALPANYARAGIDDRPGHFNINRIFY